MQDLHLVGFTKDHRHLIFSTRKDAKSGDFVLPVDEDLLDAVDEVLTHRTEVETPVESVEAPARPRVEARLSVREVQARLRAGDAIEDIAADAGVDSEWVERFAQPVRAEQRRVVDRALTAPLVRPRAGESAVPLRRAVAAAMASRDVDLTAAEFESAWSARIVGDSTWIVSFEFPNRGRQRRLEWKFDVGSGQLTTTDRFASQIAFVESDEELPPADSTVGALPARTGGGLARGPLTSGGLARPGSGRVTPPSRSAMAMPQVARPPASADSGVERAAPALPVDPAPPRPAPEPEPEAAAEPVAEEPVADRSRGASVFAPPEVDESTATPSAPERAPEAPMAPEPVTPKAETSDRVARADAAPVRGRPVPPAVPPRRPAPVAPSTNATMANTHRPVPEIAPRLPAVVDRGAPAEEPQPVRRRPALIRDRHALEEIAAAHPPSHSTESVIILRAVDGDDTDDDLDDVDRFDDGVDTADEPFEEPDDVADDEWDDEWDDEDADAAVTAERWDEAEDDSADQVGDQIDGADHDEDWIDEADDDEDWIDEADDVDEDWDELDPGDQVDDTADYEDADYDESDVDEDDADDAQDADDRQEPGPVRAVLRPGPQAPRRTVVRRRKLTAADAVRVDDDADALPDQPTRAPSSVQFRPGAATQAGRHRSEPDTNGRVTDAEADDRSDDDIDEVSETGPPPRRRRRREPLRAR